MCLQFTDVFLSVYALYEDINILAIQHHFENALKVISLYTIAIKVAI